MEESEVKPLITCSLTYEKNAERHDKTIASLFDEYITLNAPGFSKTIKLNTLSGVSASGYKVVASSAGGNIVFSMIGHWYEDFAHKFLRAYNEVIFKESLMKEAVHFEADGQYISPENDTCRAVFRICETALVILPDTHSLVRIPLCMMRDTKVSPYRFEVTDRLGRRFVMQKLGRLTDAFLKAYETRFAALVKQTKDKLGGIAPVSDSLARLLMDGMVARLSDIRAESPAFADALAEKLSSSDIAQEYGYLASVSPDIAIGVKRGLLGELTGESILLLAPVFEKNIMFLESLGDAAAATYVFKLPGEGGVSELEWKDILLRFNYCMLGVNFRREPIYLSDDALKTEKYEQYRQALHRVPYLKELRTMFAGRVIHSGFESWKKSMDSYIK
ncbi:MAG: hypothetical protein ACM3S4_12370 [Burkholderiales bacterium]